MAGVDAIVSARRLAIAVAVLFFVNGMVYGNWIPRIPELKDSLGLSNTSLGFTLLGGAIGGIVGSLVAGRLMSRIGSCRLLLGTIVPLPLIMAMIPFVGEAWLLLVMLSLIGVGDAGADLAMNAQGVIAQEALGRSIMNRLHGFWSLGFASGTIVGSVSAGLRLDFRLQVMVVAGLLLTTALLVSQSLARNDPPPTPRSSAHGARHLGGVVAPLIIVGGAAIALEGAPNEWAALLMRDDFGVGAWAGFGSVAFGAGMLIGRLSGDHILEWLGQQRMFRSALTLIMVGVVATVSTDIVPLAFIGLFVFGLGQSVIFPYLYLVAARTPGISAGMGLGVMLVGLRVGGIATALSMGVISNAVDVRFALGVVSGVAIVLLLLASGSLSRRVNTV